MSTPAPPPALDYEICLGCHRVFMPEWVSLLDNSATRTDLCTGCRSKARKEPDRFTVAWGPTT